MHHGDGNATVKAVVCAAPGRLELVERPLPDPAPGLVAVDVRAIGICGTDFHIFEGTHPYLDYPRVMGHELSGVVVGGAESAALAPGTAVVINPYLSCGVCVACRKGKRNCCTTLKVLGVHIDGGMCERIVVPEVNLYPAGDAQPPRRGDGRVPLGRRACGPPRRHGAGRPGARRRRRADRRRHRPLRPSRRRRRHPRRCLRRTPRLRRHAHGFSPGDRRRAGARFRNASA